MPKTYQGSCHCGAVRFEVELDLAQPTYRCNCSICRRTRFWPAVAREEGFRLLAGGGQLTKYLFHSRKNEHYFCRVCGVRPFGIGTETPIGRMVGVNIGCLEGAACMSGDVCCLSLLGGATSCVTASVCNFAGGVVLCNGPAQCSAATPNCCRFGQVGVCRAQSCQ